MGESDGVRWGIRGKRPFFDGGTRGLDGATHGVRPSLPPMPPWVTHVNATLPPPLCPHGLAMLAQTHVRQVSALHFPCRPGAALQHGACANSECANRQRADHVCVDYQLENHQLEDRQRTDHRGVDNECAENRGPG